MDGDYVFRLRAYATNAGADGLKVKLTVGGNEVTTFMVTDGGDKKVGIYEWKAPLQRGEHRFAVALASPGKGAAGEPTLHVENFSLEGPADMRPETHRRLLACDPKKSKHDQAVEILSRFATKAYRRPATADEVDRLVRLAEAVQAKGEKFETGIQLAIEAVLVSPKFLFRVELDDRPGLGGPAPDRRVPARRRG